MERGYWIEYKQNEKYSPWPWTMPVPFTAPNNLTFSDISWLRSELHR